MKRDRSNRISDVGELQLEVLDILRDLVQGTVYDVLEQFSEEARPRYNTVMTVLRTLEQKGLASHTKSGRSFVYQPTPDAGNVRGKVLRDVMDRVFGGSPTRLMAALLKEGDVSPEALAELRELLDGEGDGDDE